MPWWGTVRAEVKSLKLLAAREKRLDPKIPMIALGAAHTVPITGERAPGSVHKHLSFTARTTIDSRITVLLQTPVMVVSSGTSSLVASNQAGAFATSDAVSFGRHDSIRRQASGFEHRGSAPDLDRTARATDRIPALDFGSAYLVRIRWMLWTNSKLSRH